jgi:hypothetical protein
MPDSKSRLQRYTSLQEQRRRRQHMTRFNGGSKVVGGYFLNLQSWEIVTVQEETGTLPGEAGVPFVRVPVAALLLLAPAMGLAFAVLLPALGFFLTAQVAATKLVKMVAGSLQQTGSTLLLSMQPGEAYLVAKPEEEGKIAAETGEKAGSQAGPPAVAAEVEKKIDALIVEVESRRGAAK